MTQAGAHKWRAYWVCVAIAALTILDMTKVNVALPAIEHAIGANSTQLQLVVSGYVLAFGLVLVPAGRLGDQRSRKQLFLIGLSIFTVASVLAGLAPDPTILLVARLIQGIGAGIQMPQVMGMVQELFQGPERGRAFGLFGATIGLATAFGPTLGGLLIAAGGNEWGWRLMFLVNLPLGLLAIAGTVWLLPDGAKKERKPLNMDPIGIAIFAVVVVSLMWPFLFTTGRPTDDPTRWWALLLFALALAVFIWWEARYASTGKHPLIPLRLFRIASFRNGAIVSALYFAAMPTMFLVSTVFLQDGLGLTPVLAGMTTISFAVVSAVASWFGGLLVGKYGRRIVTLGVSLVLTSVVLLVLAAEFLPHAAVPWAFAAIMLLGGAGGGLVISPNQTLTLESIPVHEGGLAGSVGQLGQRVGNAVGAAIGLSMFYSVVFRESGSVDAEQIPFDAFHTAMLAVAVMLSLALIASVVDLVAHRSTSRGRVAFASE